MRHILRNDDQNNKRLKNWANSRKRAVKLVESYFIKFSTYSFAFAFTKDCDSALP